MSRDDLDSLINLKAKGNDGELAADEMRCALTAIVQEVQRFYNDTSENECKQDDEVSDDWATLKAKLRFKKIQMKKHRENLKMACLIAKTVIAAKDDEAKTLNNHLTVAKNESFNLSKKNEESSELIRSMTSKNQALFERLQNFDNFIELGYQEIRKFCDDNDQELSVLMKLKKIMICCGQFYADFCNEHEKCLQLEQRNRFLTNKLNILENDLGTITDELRKTKIVNSQRGIQYNNTKIKRNNQKIGLANSESFLGRKENISRISAEKVKLNPKMLDIENTENIDLTSHLSLVKQLIHDQDTMLKDLKKISNEFTSILT